MHLGYSETHTCRSSVQRITPAVRPGQGSGQRNWGATHRARGPTHGGQAATREAPELGITSERAGLLCWLRRQEHSMPGGLLTATQLLMPPAMSPRGVVRDGPELVRVH